MVLRPRSVLLVSAWLGGIIGHAQTIQWYSVTGEMHLQITIPRRSDHPATLVVEVSADLTNWDAGPAFTEELSNSPAAWVVRDRTPLDPAHPKRFMRLQAELSP